MSAQSQAKGRRAFSFAVAGVDDDDASALAFWLVVGLLGGWVSMCMVAGFRVRSIQFR
jgi:hypothetical protein